MVAAWWRRLWARVRGRPLEAPLPAAPAPLRGKHEGLSVKERLRRYKGGHVTLRGEVVQSKPERRIADFLFKRGVPYVYEAQMPGATPDFYLPESNIVLEHWGLDLTKYREKRMMKTRLYQKRGYILVETEKKDVPHLERVLEARLLKADPKVFERARRQRP